MHRLIVLSLLAAFVVTLIVPAGPAAAETFRGVEFPQGVASFADAVVSYNPVVTTNGVSLSTAVQQPGNAVGPPDHITGGTPRFVSLGNGGQIILRFVDNALTRSGSTAKDLWVFEIGPAVEDTFVAISQDGVTWINVGKVLGSTAGIDIDPFVSDSGARFSYVRLIDDRPADFIADDTAGADIDAVGAITTVLVDTTPPIVTVPANIIAEATGPGGAAVGYSASASDAVDGALTPSCNSASGATFPLGTTTVTCTATDAADNIGSAQFTVIVRDTSPPALTLPSFITEEATSAGGALASYAVSASDLVDGTVAVTCAPPSGSTFAFGSTTVACSATDGAGNVSDSSFVVTIVYGVCPLFDQSKSVKAGAVKPIRIQLCDAAGANLSAPDLVINAVGLRRLDGTASAQIEDPGQSNSPDANFRYDDGSYIFNLATTGLSRGTWEVQFTVAGDPRVYGVTFDVR